MHRGVIESSRLKNDPLIDEVSPAVVGDYETPVD